MFNQYYFFSSNQNQIVHNIPCEVAISQLSFSNNDQFLYQNFLAAINSHQLILKEIDDIKQELKVIKEENNHYVEIIQKLEKQKREYESSEKKRKKIFKKNIICPFQGCQNKYSSKIALNSHIRAKHKRNSPTPPQSHTPDCQLL